MKTLSKTAIRYNRNKYYSYSRTLFVRLALLSNQLTLSQKTKRKEEESTKKYHILGRNDVPSTARNKKFHHGTRIFVNLYRTFGLLAGREIHLGHLVRLFNLHRLYPNFQPRNII